MTACKVIHFLYQKLLFVYILYTSYYILWESIENYVIPFAFLITMIFEQFCKIRDLRQIKYEE
jgi:hypothetical protein